MSFFRFFRRKRAKQVSPWDIAATPINPAADSPVAPLAEPVAPKTAKPKHQATDKLDVRRYFHNEHRFQCYTSWFAHWGGWISAGHCLTDAHDHVPNFAENMAVTSWPDGLDAALAGCTLPKTPPPAPHIGQDIIIKGFPAGSRHMEQRTGRIYFERSPGQWIAHIFEPDEPVVTGMSGGPVLDAQTLEPIGITITRNSPADLNNDRDPDESADFIALSDVWDAVSKLKKEAGPGTV